MSFRFNTFPVLPMSAHRHDGELVVSFDVPGVDPGSIDVSVERHVLTVTAERSFPWAEGDRVLASERPAGRFTRRIVLSKGLDTERIAADYTNGVLTLTVPVAEEAKPRKVEITSGSETGEITAEAA